MEMRLGLSTLTWLPPKGIADWIGRKDPHASSLPPPGFALAMGLVMAGTVFKWKTKGKEAFDC